MQRGALDRRFRKIVSSGWWSDPQQRVGDRHNNGTPNQTGQLTFPLNVRVTTLFCGQQTFCTYDVVREGNSSAPEFTFVQFEARASLTSTLKNSTKVFIMIVKIAVVPIHDEVPVSHVKSPNVSSTFLWKCPGHKLGRKAEVKICIFQAVN